MGLLLCYGLLEPCTWVQPFSAGLPLSAIAHERHSLLGNKVEQEVYRVVTEVPKQKKFGELFLSCYALRGLHIERGISQGNFTLEIIHWAISTRKYRIIKWTVSFSNSISMDFPHQFL